MICSSGPCGELERALEQTFRGRVRPAPVRRVAGRERSLEGRPPELLVVLAPVDRLVEVERDELRRLRVALRDRVGEPLRDPPVQRPRS